MRPNAKIVYKKPISPNSVRQCWWIYVQRELADGSRTVVETEHWLAVVPYWAAWPFETLLLPKTHVLRITDLSDEQRDSLALALKKLTSRYDNLFQCSFPYSIGLARRAV